MHRYGSWLRIGLFCILLAGLTPARADALLRFEVTRTVIDSKQVQVEGENQSVPVEDKATYPVVVMLGNGFVYLEEQDSGTLYDFQHKQILRLDQSAQTYRRTSLYADIGFRVAEFRNRMFLGNALNAADIANNPMAVGLMEHLFSLQPADSKTQIDISAADGKLRYQYRDRLLFESSQELTTLSAADSSMFSRFVRYRLNGHPVILSELEKNQGIPAEFTIHLFNLNLTSYTYRLITLEQIPVSRPDLSGYTAQLTVDAKNKLREIITIARSKLADFEPSGAALLAQAGELFKHEQYLDAMLAYYEYMLKYGKPFPDYYAGQKEIMLTDDRVRLLEEAIRPESKEQAEQAVTTLDKLAESSQGFAHILNLYAAKIRSSLGEGDTAFDYYLRMLMQDPLFVAAYKELGDFYYDAYRAELAWLCWDFARELSPEHYLLQGVNEFEKKIEELHPEFF